MRERKVILTWEAIYDLIEIADYIERDFGKSHADRFETNIRQQIKDIGYMGGIYGNTHIITAHILFSKKLFHRPLYFM